MRYLLDTNEVIRYLKGVSDAMALVTALADEGIFLSVITLGELYEGLLRVSGQPANDMAPFETFVSAVDVIPVDTTIAQQYGRIRRDLRTRGLMIPDNDVWIAATATIHDLTVVTRDQHFSRVTGLNLYERKQP